MESLGACGCGPSSQFAGGCRSRVWGVRYPPTPHGGFDAAPDCGPRVFGRRFYNTRSIAPTIPAVAVITAKAATRKSVAVVLVFAFIYLAPFFVFARQPSGGAERSDRRAAAHRLGGERYPPPISRSVAVSYQCPGAGSAPLGAMAVRYVQPSGA
jgi:hypothetical protein